MVVTNTKHFIDVFHTFVLCVEQTNEINFVMLMSMMKLVMMISMASVLFVVCVGVCVCV